MDLGKEGVHEIIFAEYWDMVLHVYNKPIISEPSNFLRVC